MMRRSRRAAPHASGAMGRVGLPLVRSWMEEQRRKYDWARSGASAEQAVWLQLLETEAIGHP